MAVTQVVIHVIDANAKKGVLVLRNLDLHRFTQCTDIFRYDACGGHEFYFIFTNI